MAAVSSCVHYGDDSEDVPERELSVPLAVVVRRSTRKAAKPWTARAMGNREIVSCIAKNILDSPSKDNADKKALLSLALSCRSFSEPALDVLWRSLSSTLPLLHLLPVKIATQGDGNGKRQFVSFPEDHQWSRWQYYAQRVKEICSMEVTCEVHSCAVFHLIQAQSAVFTLLPNLRSFAFTGCAEGVALIPFLSPSVHELSIEWEHPIRQDIVLQEVLARAPNVSIATVSGLLAPDSFTALARFPCLRVLTLVIKNAANSTIPRSSFNGLSASLSLTSLTVAFFDEKVWLDGVTFSSGFKRLESLCITGSLDQLLVLITLTASPSLQTIRLKIRRFKNSLSSCCMSGNTLPRLTRLVAPLFRSQSVTEFFFACVPLDASVDVDDGDIEDIAKAWPRLRTLNLQVQAKGHPIGPTIRCLSSLAVHNPDLCSLVLSLGPYNTFPAGGIPITSHGLRRIVLVTTVLADELAMARILDTLFPSLGEVIVLKKIQCRDFSLGGIVSDSSFLLPNLVKFAQALRKDQAERLRLQTATA